MSSHFTQAEWEVVLATYPGEQFAFHHVSQTQLSIARYCGGITFGSYQYTYLPYTDELIRDDVLKLILDARKDASKDAKAASKAAQSSLL